MSKPKKKKEKKTRHNESSTSVKVKAIAASLASKHSKKIQEMLRDYVSDLHREAIYQAEETMTSSDEFESLLNDIKKSLHMKDNIDYDIDETTSLAQAIDNAWNVVLSKKVLEVELEKLIKELETTVVETHKELDVI